MGGKVTLVAGLVAVVIAVPAGSRAQDAEMERTVPVRSFERFEYETATVKGFWAELGFLYEDTDFNNRDTIPATQIDVDTWTPFARFAYGGEMWEADLLVPYRDIDVDVGGAGFKDDGIGDVELTGRFIPLRTAILDAGAGVNFSFPSGDEDHLLGAGEVGALPFFTAAIDFSVLEARGHVGYQFFTEDNDSGTATDRIFYGFGLLMPLFDRVVFRNEFAGVEFDQPGDPKVVSFLTGLDFRIPIGGFDLLLRPTGLVGVTQRAPDWGFGGSIVFTSPSFRAAKSTYSEYGVVIEE